MLEDFPLLDRGQPPLPGENQSTITTDLLLDAWARRKKNINTATRERLQDGKKAGAIAYISSEFVSSLEGIREAAHEQ